MGGQLWDVPSGSSPGSADAPLTSLVHTLVPGADATCSAAELPAATDSLASASPTSSAGPTSPRTGKNRALTCSFDRNIQTRGGAALSHHNDEGATRRLAASRPAPPPSRRPRPLEHPGRPAGPRTGAAFHHGGCGRRRTRRPE